MAWGWFLGLLGLSTLLVALACILKSRTIRIGVIQLAAVICAIGLFEGYLLILARPVDDGTRIEGSAAEGFTDADDQLGYVPHRNVRVTARKFYKSDLIYDVTYTIGANGLRITPPAPHANRGCVLFFGDSITFGEGVNDDENFPYRVGLQTAGDFAVHNFGFSGYGPHQMLAKLQVKRETSIGCLPTHFIYFCIPEHVERVAGLAFWDKHGPRFRLMSNGTVTRDGNFDTAPAFFPFWTALTDNFQAWQRLFGRNRSAKSADLDLLIAIIAEAARVTRKRYPESRFHMILWDGSDNDRVNAIERGSTAAGVMVHRLTRAIPDFRANHMNYVLSEHDLHPNARQHELLARYIAQSILRAGQSAYR